MKPREYCCCAVPLVKAGIYTTLTEQFVVAVVVGTLSVATPSSKHKFPPVALRSLTLTFQVVGAATPSFAPALFAAVCYVAAAIQILGFLGVAQVRTPFHRISLLSHKHRTNQSCIADTPLSTQVQLSQCSPSLLLGLSFLPLVTPPPNQNV